MREAISKATALVSRHTQATRPCGPLHTAAGDGTLDEGAVPFEEQMLMVCVVCLDDFTVLRSTGQRKGRLVDRSRVTDMDPQLWALDCDTAI